MGSFHPEFAKCFLKVTLYDMANSQDLAQKNADAYSMYSDHTAATSSTPQPFALSDDSESSSLAFTRRSKCYFCGGSYHNRGVCPARDECHRAASILFCSAGIRCFFPVETLLNSAVAPSRAMVIASISSSCGFDC